MAEKSLVYTDATTKKKYRVRYDDAGPVPDDDAIRQSIGLSPVVKTYEYRHPDDGKAYSVRYTGSAPPNGEDIVKAAKPVRTMNNVKNTMRSVANVMGRALQGLAGGGYAASPPLETDKTGRVRPARSKRPTVQGGRDPLLLVASPILAPVAKAAGVVGNSVRNFTQGSLTEGIKRYDLSNEGQVPSTSVLANAKQMVAPIFKDIPGNVRAGVRAAVTDTGAERIGKVVPELAPSTLAGTALNTATAMGSDPLNLLLAGAPELAGKAVATMSALRELSKPGEVAETIARGSKFPGVRAFLPEGATARPVRGGSLGRNPSPDAMAARERLDTIVSPGPGRAARPIPARPPAPELPHVLLGGKKPTPLPSETVDNLVQRAARPSVPRVRTPACNVRRNPSPTLL